jgi:hypothetical protein
MYVQVGFAVADGGAALHGFTNSLKAPGAMTVPIESTHDNGMLQQLTLVKKASSGRQQHIPSRALINRLAGCGRSAFPRHHIRHPVLQRPRRHLP